MTSLTLCFLLLKCQMIVCPSSLHSGVQAEIKMNSIYLWFKGLIFPPSEPPGEIMSFGVSPVNYSDSDSDSFFFFGLPRGDMKLQYCYYHVPIYA